MVGTSRARKSLAVRIGMAVALALVILGTLAGPAFAASVSVRVEGAERTLFTGAAPLDARSILDTDGAAHAESSNALTALDAAAQIGAFPYVLDNTAYGLYVSSIGGELPVPSPPYPGWSYRVNGASPSVGADQCGLKAADSVLWYYGTWDASPTAAVVPAACVAVGSTATVTAEQLDQAGVASTLASASVFVGSQTATSGADGTAGFRLNAPGDYGVRVSKDGYVRSAVEVLRVRYTTSFSTLAAGGTKVRRGSRVTLSGKLSGAGKTPAGRRIDLLARKAGSKTWAVIGHTTASDAGAFKFSVKVSAATYYRASFAGDSVFASTTSADRLIKLR